VNFTRSHKDEIKKFGMFSKYEDSQEYLSDHLHLVCEETANYLVLWCIDLEIEEVRTMYSFNHSLLNWIAHLV